MKLYRNGHFYMGSKIRSHDPNMEVFVYTQICTGPPSPSERSSTIHVKHIMQYGVNIVQVWYAASYAERWNKTIYEATEQDIQGNIRDLFQNMSAFKVNSKLMFYQLY
jgi:hypothetical protein